MEGQRWLRPVQVQARQNASSIRFWNIAISTVANGVSRHSSSILYSVEPDYPWPEYDYFVLRHRDNRKWFAVGMTVPYRKLGLDWDGDVDIIDVKCGSLLMGSYRARPGILPGYHMNKAHWITLLLDGGTEDGLIKELLDISYELTSMRRRKM